MAAVQAPPAAEAFHCELGCLVRHADVDEPVIARDIVRPVGDGGADAEVGEVLREYLDRIALGTPTPPGILEVTHTLPLLRVDRQDWIASPEKGRDLPIDLVELSIAIRGLAALLRLRILLQRVLHLVQSATDRVGADRMASLGEQLGDGIGATRRPP